MPPIAFASPLFILRDECQRDLFAVLRRLKEIGFDGVEFLGLFGRDPHEIRRVLDELGLMALGDHVSLGECYADIDGTLEPRRMLGCRYLSVAGIPDDALPGTAGWDETRRRYAVVSKAAARAGMTLLYHNHDNELLSRVGDVHQLDAILDGIPADVLKFEPDLGWISIGGGDARHYLRKYRHRCPVLHLKDYYATDPALLGNVHDYLPQVGSAERGSFAFRPTGYGVMNYPALLDDCLACNPGWMVLDHDLAYHRDSYADLKLSLDFARALLRVHR
ncbi:MAG: sugar phosphate isomerase/epimerase [Eubacteriales bacterium]|nr:sugar phosphate isomerase/epimerase [Eubacteriales bacterium]